MDSYSGELCWDCERTGVVAGGYIGRCECEFLRAGREMHVNILGRDVDLYVLFLVGGVCFE